MFQTWTPWLQVPFSKCFNTWTPWLQVPFSTPGQGSWVAKPRQHSPRRNQAPIATKGYASGDRNQADFLTQPSGLILTHSAIGAAVVLRTLSPAPGCLYLGLQQPAPAWRCGLCNGQLGPCISSDPAASYLRFGAFLVRQFARSVSPRCARSCSHANSQCASAAACFPPTDTAVVPSGETAHLQA